MEPVAELGPVVVVMADGELCHSPVSRTASAYPKRYPSHPLSSTRLLPKHLLQRGLLSVPSQLVHPIHGGR